MLLCALDGGGCRTLSELWDEPLRWSPDGRSVLVASCHDARRATVTRVDVSTGSREPVRTLAPADPTGVFGCCWMAISADGRDYAYSFGRSLSDLSREGSALKATLDVHSRQAGRFRDSELAIVGGNESGAGGSPRGSHVKQVQAASLEPRGVEA
jgi:hypothetical protein